LIVSSENWQEEPKWISARKTVAWGQAVHAIVAQYYHSKAEGLLERDRKRITRSHHVDPTTIERDGLNVTANP
jgi:hypothetical protein